MGWTHSMCCDCWKRKHPEEGGEWKPIEDQVASRDPVVVIDREVEVCCFCGKRHASGIFVREDPSILRCGGNH